MHRISIPPPVNLGPELGNETVTFSQFAETRLTRDQKAGKDMTTLFLAKETLDIIKAAEGLDYVSIPELNYNLLSDLVKSPSAPYNPQVAIALIPFMRAIVNAQPE